MNPLVKAFLDPDSETYSYVVYDQPGGHAAIIDPVLDFDPKSGRTRNDGAQRLVDFVHEQTLTLDWILETHAHADHLSAAPFVRDQLGGHSPLAKKFAMCKPSFARCLTSKRNFSVTAVSLITCLRTETSSLLAA